MNIFATYPCPKQSAQYLDNKRVIKMILESSQMLSTALKTHAPMLYRKKPTQRLTKANKPLCEHIFNDCLVSGPTHANHPANVWVRSSRSNYMWLIEHMSALCVEYTKRSGGKHHKCEQYIQSYRDNAHIIPSGGLTKFANCARNRDKGVDYTHIDDVHKAYQLYLADRWKTDVRKPVWK